MTKFGFSEIVKVWPTLLYADILRKATTEYALRHLSPDLNRNRIPKEYVENKEPVERVSMGVRED